MSCDEMRLEKFEYVIKNVAQFFSGAFLPYTLHNNHNFWETPVTLKKVDD